MPDRSERRFPDTCKLENILKGGGYRYWFNILRGCAYRYWFKVWFNVPYTNMPATAMKSIVAEWPGSILRPTPQATNLTSAPFSVAVSTRSTYFLRSATSADL